MSQTLTGFIAGGLKADLGVGEGRKGCTDNGVPLWCYP